MVVGMYKKYKEIINYLIVGGCTVVISIASYALFADVFKIDYIISNIISWIIAVTFAYFTNSKFVFNSKAVKKDKLSEVVNFFIYRLLSLGIETFLLYILVDLISINDLISKTFVQIIVIILNYIFSKFLVFKKKIG